VGVRLGAVRSDHAAVGQELTGVVEDDDPVAEKIPALLGMTGDGDSSVTVGGVRGRTGREMPAHRVASGWSFCDVGAGFGVGNL
jgi:hypothetical protein